MPKFCIASADANRPSTAGVAGDQRASAPLPTTKATSTASAPSLRCPTAMLVVRSSTTHPGGSSGSPQSTSAAPHACSATTRASQGSRASIRYSAIVTTPSRSEPPAASNAVPTWPTNAPMPVSVSAHASRAWSRALRSIRQSAPLASTYAS